MSFYLIGDVQGCDESLQRLIDAIGFSPSRDTLYVLGDLVNRGPASDAVLRRMMALGGAAQCLLGNHDLHLLAVAQSGRKPHRNDTLDCVLQAPDAPGMLHWLRHQRLALSTCIGGKELLMVHAGVLPSWTVSKTLALAGEVETQLQSPDAAHFFPTMYGNAPAAWSDALQAGERNRVIINALTRLRFCTAGGDMEFATKDSANAAPPGYMPWFDVPHRMTANVTVAFGHWSTLGTLDRGNVLAMDTGCVWGGCLSALRIEANTRAGAHGGLWHTELIQVKCPQTQVPGT